MSPAKGKIYINYMLLPSSVIQRHRKRARTQKDVLRASEVRIQGR